MERLIAAAAAHHDLDAAAPAARAAARDREIGDGFLRVGVLDAAAHRSRGLEDQGDAGGRGRDVLLKGRVSLRRDVDEDGALGREPFEAELPIGVRGAVLRPPAAADVDREDLRPRNRPARGILHEAGDRRARGEGDGRPDVLARGLHLEGGNGLAGEALPGDAESVLAHLQPLERKGAVVAGHGVRLVAVHSHQSHLDARAPHQAVFAMDRAKLRARDRLPLRIDYLAARFEPAAHDERQVLDRVAGLQRNARLARRRIAAPGGFDRQVPLGLEPAQAKGTVGHRQDTLASEQSPGVARGAAQEPAHPHFPRDPHSGSGHGLPILVRHLPGNAGRLAQSEVGRRNGLSGRVDPRDRGGKVSLSRGLDRVAGGRQPGQTETSARIRPRRALGAAAGKTSESGGREGGDTHSGHRLSRPFFNDGSRDRGPEAKLQVRFRLFALARAHRVLDRREVLLPQRLETVGACRHARHAEVALGVGLRRDLLGRDDDASGRLAGDVEHHALERSSALERNLLIGFGLDLHPGHGDETGRADEDDARPVRRVRDSEGPVRPRAAFPDVARVSIETRFTRDDEDPRAGDRFAGFVHDVPRGPRRQRHLNVEKRVLFGGIERPGEADRGKSGGKNAQGDGDAGLVERNAEPALGIHGSLAEDRRVRSRRLVEQGLIVGPVSGPLHLRARGRLSRGVEDPPRNGSGPSL